MQNKKESSYKTLIRLLKTGHAYSTSFLKRQCGYKSTDSLKSSVSMLRAWGYEVVNRESDGYSTYQIPHADNDDRWPCMLSKEEWTFCYGNGCRHKSKCKATIR